MKFQHALIVTVTAAIALASVTQVASATPITININAGVYGDFASGFPTLGVPEPAGIYLLTEVDPQTNSSAVYTAWDPIGFSSGSTWINSLEVYEGIGSSETKVANMGDGVVFSSPQAAFSDPNNRPITVTLLQPGFLDFGVGDNFLVDNLGGISLSIQPLPVPAFELLELAGSSCPGLPSGDIGCFDLINNTTNYSITGFQVGNPDAIADSTTRANWSANIGSINFGFGSESSFDYFDNGGAGANPLGFGSDSSFFFNAGIFGSPFQIDAIGPDGPIICSGNTDGGCDPFAVSEPSSLLLLGVGFFGLAILTKGKHRYRTSRRTLWRRVHRGYSAKQVGQFCVQSAMQ